MSRLMIREPAQGLTFCEHYTDYGHGHEGGLDDFMWVYDVGGIIVEERHYTTHVDMEIPSGAHYCDLFHGSYDVGRMVITLVPPLGPKWETRQPPASIRALLSREFPDAEELIYFS